MSGSDKLKPKVLKTENAESCKTRRSNLCSPSTSLSSSTTSSTASIVSFIEAATSLVLQDDVISVLGVEGDKLPVADVPAGVPATAYALPGASKSCAARGREVFTVAAESAPVAALPGASKLRAA